MLTNLKRLRLPICWSDDVCSQSTVARYAFWAALGFSFCLTLVQGLIWCLAYVTHSLPSHPTDMLLSVFTITPLVAWGGAFLVYYRAGMRIHGMVETNKALDEMSRIDPLSKLLNRRAFLEAFSGRANDAMLIVFDIDHFKQVNDRHGHAAGDEVIRAVAGIIQRVFDRDTDVVCRLGGEEFGVLIQASRPDEDFRRAERVRAEIVRCEFSSGGQRFFVTLSGGMAHACVGVEFETAFKNADKALYAAKQRGRNLILNPGFCDARRA